MEKQAYPLTTMQISAPYPSPPVMPARPILPRRSFSTSSLPAHHRHDASTGTDNLLDSSDRGYHPRTISPISKLNNELTDISHPAHAILRSRTDQLLSPSAHSPSLPSAPRYTRSPIVRYPSTENIKVVNTEVTMQQTSTPFSRGNYLETGGNGKTLEISERDSFGVSPSQSRQFRLVARSFDSAASRRASAAASAAASRPSFPPSSPAMTSFSGYTTEGDPKSSPSHSFAIRPLPPRPSHTRPESDSSLFTRCEVASVTGQVPLVISPGSPAHPVLSHSRIPSNSGAKYYF